MYLEKVVFSNGFHVSAQSRIHPFSFEIVPAVQQLLKTSLAKASASDEDDEVDSFAIILSYSYLRNLKRRKMTKERSQKLQQWTLKV